MTIDRAVLQEEIDKNLAFFETKLPELLPQHRDRYVLLRKQSIVGIFDTIRDAQTAGNAIHPDGIFSIQQVTNIPFHFGMFSYVMHMGSA